MNNLYDVIVIGGGPAGLTAALYLARARYRVLVIEKESFGGQIKITSEVVNYPGIMSTDGHTLTETMRRQAESFGAEFMIAQATSLELDKDIKVVHTSKGRVEAFGILLAMGAYPRMVGFKGEAEFKGHGVAYCATCDGEFFTGKEVFVVGGGYAAAEESVFLTRYAKHVTILMRGADFKCDEVTALEAKNHEKITVCNHMEIQEVRGDDFLRGITYKNTQTGEVINYEAEEGDTFGVFVFAGYQPETTLVKELVKLTDYGYIWTDKKQKTSIDGVYAAGDICEKSLRQVVTAVGDGALAATELERYATMMHHKTGQKPVVKEVVKVKEEGKEASQSEGGFFSGEILQQLDTVFSRMANPLILELCLDEREVSRELKTYMEEMSALTDKLRVVENPDIELERPCVRILHGDGSYSGISFHGVPGGHEFTSFILGLYNVSGPGQPLDESVKARISTLSKERKIKLLVSLSCTMCPDLVVAAGRLASLSQYVEVDTYDINHFPQLKDQYKVMSVPCMVIDDKDVSFGKKNLEQLLDILEK